jgi:Domain of unknown function (DUF4386)
MTAMDRVSREARLRPRVAVVSALAGVMLFASSAIQATGPQPKVNEVTVQLLVTNKRGALEVIGALINGLGLLGLAATLVFLFTAAKARRPDLSKGLLITGIVGGVLAAVGGIAYGVVITIKSHEFATHGAQTYPQANALLSSPGLAILQYAGLIGSLLLAIAFVLTSLNAMRVGLLTKFIGYLGIAAAAASLLLIGSAPALLIEVFWLFAVAYLLSGRWPNGDPPAWRTGQAEPWPSGAELREQRQRSAGGRGRSNAKPAPEPRREPVAAGTSSGSRASTPKRKRKRRK